MHAAVAGDMAVDGLRIESLWVRDRAGVVADPHDERAVLVTKLCRPISDVAKALDSYPLALESSGQTETTHIVGLVTGFSEHVVQSLSSRLASPGDTPLVNRLSRDTPERIDLFSANRLIGIRDPRHLPLTGPQVWGRDIDGGANKVLFDQLGGVAPRDPFELFRLILPDVDSDGAIRAAKRDVNDGAFVGH
jgi:hypothetical protein